MMDFSYIYICAIRAIRPSVNCLNKRSCGSAPAMFYIFLVIFIIIFQTASATDPLAMMKHSMSGISDQQVTTPSILCILLATPIIISMIGLAKTGLNSIFSGNVVTGLSSIVNVDNFNPAN